ncbi:MAG: hypothetical protein KF760_32465 [Candidatus Eremiobacteraeota bacterium]|nr:hypothetical protein [Candidatus Eremiobacteraeota bacterium]MCW5872123.1 hypothetical protein [Candidatus Eremiobacteraeota bacterium]
MSGTSQRLQNVIHRLRLVQGNIQEVQNIYTAAAADANASNTDMINTKKPMANALKDRGDISVAADGKTLVGLVNGTLSRLRKTEGKLVLSTETAKNAGFPLDGLHQEIFDLSETAENADARAILKQSLGWMGRGQTYHQWAARTADWARGSAAYGENRLSQVGNSLNAVARDNADGKNVTNDMAAAKPNIDLAIRAVGEHNDHAKTTVGQEAEVIVALAQVQEHLAQALALSQPVPPAFHRPNLLDVLQANDPTP